MRSRYSGIMDFEKNTYLVGDKDNAMTKVISGKELSIKLKAEMAAQVRTSTIINLISAEWWK